MTNRSYINPESFRSIEITREDFSYFGLDGIHTSLLERFKGIEGKKKTRKNFGGTIIIQGPIGSGKSLVLNEALKEAKKAIIIQLTIRRGSVIFEPTDELIQKIDLELKRNKQHLKRFFSVIKSDDAMASLDFVELLEFIPIYGTIASKAIRLGAKSISMISRRLAKKGKSIQEIALIENEHEKRVNEIHEKLTLLSKVKPVIIIIDNLHWMQKDDQQIFEQFNSLFSGKMPVLVIANFAEIKVTKVRQTPETFDELENLIQRWGGKKNTHCIQNLKPEKLKDWLEKRFANAEITNDFLTGTYNLTSGNLRYLVKFIEFLVLQNLIDENNSINSEDWILPEEWSGLMPTNIINFESERLDKLLELESIKTTTDYVTRKKILEKAAVVGSPFQAFEMDILEGVLTKDESFYLPEILDFAIDSHILEPFEYRIEFATEIVHSCLYKQLGLAVRSELHYKTATALENFLKTKDIGDKYESIYYLQLAKHFEGATESYSETRSLEAQEKVHRYYILSSMGKFTYGGTEEALSLLSKICSNLYFNPFEIYNLALNRLDYFVKNKGVSEKSLIDFITNEFFPSYFTILCIFFLPEIIERNKSEIDLSYLNPMYEFLLENYSEGILFKAGKLNSILNRFNDVTIFLNKIVLLFAPITYMFQFLEGKKDAVDQNNRLKIIYEEFRAINTILINGFSISNNILDEAYLYNLLAHYTNKIKGNPKKYYQKGGDSYLKASKLPIDDIVKKARITRNAGWNYKSADNLKQSIKAFKTAKKIIVDSKLNFDYIQFRIAEYDLRIFQTILLEYMENPETIPKELIIQFRNSFNQFWNMYFVDRKYSSYPLFLLKEFNPLSKMLGKNFIQKLKLLSKPIPTIKKENSSFKVLLVTNEWDYWLADVVHERIRSDNPEAFVDIKSPNEFKDLKNYNEFNAIILFGGPKAQHIGDLVVQTFKGETNFRFLTWRHEAGFGGIWSKKHKKILHILIAGNDEETIDGTILFLKNENPWESNYHFSTLTDYFKH